MSWTDERIEKAKALWDAGRSGSEIAAMIGGCSRNAVIGLAYRRGWPGRDNKVRVKRTYKPRLFGPDKSLKKVEEINPTRKRHGLNISSLERRVLGNPIGNGKGRQIFTSPAPIEPLPPIDTMPPTLSWAELEDQTHNITQCRAILPADGDKTICGRKTVVGTSWCECHLRRYATPVFVKTKQPERPAWQDTRTGRKGAVFLSGREKMKAY